MFCSIQRISMASSSQAVVHNIEPPWIEMLSVTKDTPAKHTGPCELCGRQTDQITYTHERQYEKQPRADFPSHSPPCAGRATVLSTD
jgi:hypothetical protein